MKAAKSMKTAPGKKAAAMPAMPPLLEPIPISPLTATHEQILATLSKGYIYRCYDPDEEWAPYIREMINAKWLKASNVDITIDTEGLNQLKLIQTFGI